jgi:hypothetical protein
MAARTRRIRHDDETRARIQAGVLINRLHRHVMGEIEMTPTQVQAATVLLKKTLPDLAQTENHNTTVEHKYAIVPPKLSNEEWLKRAEQVRNGTPPHMINWTQSLDS